MSDDRLILVKAWFKKAENDLANAEHTMTMALHPPTQFVFMPSSALKNT